HPDDREFVWGSVQRSLKARERFQIMYRIVTPKGRVKWVWEKGMGIFSPEGELIALEGFISDITDRKLTEEKLRRSRKQLRIHAEHLHSVLEGERSQIAREIHDELGQILTALKMDLFWVDRKVPEKNAEIHEKVHSMISHIDSTIKTVEHILLELRPGLLEDLGLTSAIEWQAEEFQRRTGIVCDAILDPDPERLIKDSKLSTAVFRICQEALTNIARHAYATKVEITLKLTRSFVELMVSDNGQGIMRSDIRKADSFGILGIRERTSLLGGKVTIAGRKGKGTTLRVRIPLSQSQSA
ncbi:MAG TPA: histidine kinase, partial [Deltaproteobacteria bacterium]|nr:histidine kinase [Deltaproteobacteria bacterium]